MTRTFALLKIVSISALLCLAATSVSHAQEIRWISDYNAARQQARDSQRPLVLDFGTVNCTWCRKLDATTLRDPNVVKLVGDRFVAVRIDASRDPALAQTLGITSYPTLVFAAPDGKILGKHEGYVEAARFAQQLEQTLRECGTTSRSIGTPSPGSSSRLTFPPYDPGLLKVERR